MKPVLRLVPVALLQLLVSSALWAQTPAAPPAPAAAPVATLSTQPDGARYGTDPSAAQLLEKAQLRIAKLKGPCEVIFIGDSITQNWKDGAIWQKYYGARHALNYGVSSDTTQNVLFRLNYDGLKTLKPKVAVILIGTNNTAKNTPAEIAAGVRAVIDKTRSLFPASKIILLDILPTARRTQIVVEANELIAKLSDEKTIFRLNLGEKMVKEGDSWRGLDKGRLHLTEEGYRIWAETMEPLLARLLGDTKS